MKLTRRASLALLGVVTVVLASILVFLYIKSSTDQSSNYTPSRDLIRHIKQLNAQWDSEVLKARIALTHNYDPLAAPLNEMNSRVGSARAPAPACRSCQLAIGTEHLSSGGRGKSAAGGPVQIP